MPSETPEFVECASVAPGVILIAMRSGNFIVTSRSPISADGPFLTSLREPSVSSTRALLNAAMFVEINERKDDGTLWQQELTLPRVILNLISSYHTTHATVPTLRVAVNRFRDGTVKACEFSGAENSRGNGARPAGIEDIRVLGLPAKRLVEFIRPSMAEELVDYFKAAAHADDPIGVVGYSYAVRTQRVVHRTVHIKAAQAVCPPGIDATRCLRVH